MKVRYWNSQVLVPGTSPKEIVSYIKRHSTVATVLPAGDIPVIDTFFILGGRGSIAQFLAASGGNSFYGRLLSGHYLRFSAGFGKHYTLIALTAGQITPPAAKTIVWYGLGILPTTRTTGWEAPGGGMRAAQGNVYVSFTTLASALRTAEAKMTDHVLDVAGIDV